MGAERWNQYLNTLKTNFTKVTRLEFLQPDNSVAFFLDNNPYNRRSGAFIQDGTLSVNLQNGQRRTANVKLSNLDHEYDYNVNKVWFGNKLRLKMGLILPDGSQYLLPQGVFYAKDPQEIYNPTDRFAQYSLVDKWAVLDGTLGGQLEGIYECPVNSNIFTAIASLLSIDCGNGYPLDNVPPVFTNYYNNKTQVLPDGSTVSLIMSPYTARFDSDGNTYADVVLGLNEMIAGWVGYDATGTLRIDPSQDDILDINKPIMWAFTPEEKEFLGATYSIKNSEVKNDIIRVGQALNGGYAVVGGRAQNYDPNSDTNINIIGFKIDRQEKSGYYTEQVCMDLAEFELKRNTILKKSVSITSKQMFHLQENNLVSVRRIDKKGSPIERHLINGYSIPLSAKGSMTISATSAADFPIATVTSLSDYTNSL